jgi:hypothetical protein
MSKLAEKLAKIFKDEQGGNYIPVIHRTGWHRKKVNYDGQWTWFMCAAAEGDNSLWPIGSEIPASEILKAKERKYFYSKVNATVDVNMSDEEEKDYYEKIHKQEDEKRRRFLSRNI